MLYDLILTVWIVLVTVFLVKQSTHKKESILEVENEAENTELTKGEYLSILKCKHLPPSGGFYGNVFYEIPLKDAVEKILTKINCEFVYNEGTEPSVSLIDRQPLIKSKAKKKEKK